MNDKDQELEKHDVTIPVCVGEECIGYYLLEFKEQEEREAHQRLYDEEKEEQKNMTKDTRNMVGRENSIKRYKRRNKRFF